MKPVKHGWLIILNIFFLVIPLAGLLLNNDQPGSEFSGLVLGPVLLVGWAVAVYDFFLSIGYLFEKNAPRNLRILVGFIALPLLTITVWPILIIISL